MDKDAKGPPSAYGRSARIGTLRQLEIIVKLADCGSIAGAAEELHMTQPSASMQLKTLADRIGLPLYELNARRVVLTEVGQAVVTHARGVLDQMARLDTALADLKGLQAGRLRLAVARSAECFVPHLLGPFVRLYPQITVELEVANHQALLNRCDANQDDLYLLGERVDDPRMSCEVIGSNHLVVIAPRSHRCAQSSAVDWSEIEDELFIVREAGSATRLATETHLRQQGCRLQHKMTIASNEGIKHAVLARMGLAVVPRLTLDQGDHDELVELALRGFPIAGSWHMAWRNTRPQSLVTKTFLDYVLNEGRDMLADATTYWEHHHRPKLPTQV